MNHVDSDLEEGEILDDSPSPLCPVKHKELPRRYVILEKSPKHKKDCKYAIRHHTKKLAKLKKLAKSPIRAKIVHIKKSHLKSCSRHSSSSSDGPFKDYSIISPNAKPNWSAKNHSKAENAKIMKDSSFSQMLEKYKAMQSKNSNNFVNSSKQKKNKLVQRIRSSTNLEKECEITNNTCNDIKPDFPEVIVIEDDDDDDDEELRRIALATCAKRMASEQPLVNLNSKLDCNSICLPEITSLAHNSNSNIDNQVADNYEVVDMEVDEDNSPDTTDNLFVIDKKPSLGFQGDQNAIKSTSEQKVNCSGDDSDFETDMLRAELINVMFTNRSVSDELVSTEKPLKNLHIIQASLPKSDKQIFPQNIVQNSKHKLDIPTPVIEENKSPQRFIISVSGESSSEESDEGDVSTVNTLPENPVASIAALISDIRQQSDCKKSNKVVPKAVSCLSKAQQEEYNALVKILTDNKRMPQDEPEVKNKIVHSPMDDLKLLEKKLMVVKEDLKKRKVLMNGLAKQVAAKKQLYLRAKLNVQSLKEKLVQAEKIRRVRLDAWSKSCKNFETVKKSVSNLELKLNNLQDSCSKIGSSIQGQNYNLPFMVGT